MSLIPEEPLEDQDETSRLVPIPSAGYGKDNKGGMIKSLNGSETAATQDAEGSSIDALFEVAGGFGPFQFVATAVVVLALTTGG